LKSNACAKIKEKRAYPYLFYLQAIAERYQPIQNQQAGFFCQDFLQGVKMIGEQEGQGAKKGRGHCQSSRFFRRL
jgi:hypothetical protein